MGVNTIIKGMYGNVNVIYIIMYVHIQCIPLDRPPILDIIILYEIRRYIELRIGIERYMYNGSCFYKTSCSMHE